MYGLILVHESIYDIEHLSSLRKYISKVPEPFGLFKKYICVI